MRNKDRKYERKVSVRVRIEGMKTIKGRKEKQKIIREMGETTEGITEEGKRKKRGNGKKSRGGVVEEV